MHERIRQTWATSDELRFEIVTWIERTASTAPASSTTTATATTGPERVTSCAPTVEARGRRSSELLRGRSMPAGGRLAPVDAPERA